MKLLISLSYYSPHISGLTLSVKRLAELLVSNRYNVTVLAAQHKKDLPQTETIHGVHVTRVPFLFRFSKGFFMPEFIFVAYSSLRKADAVLIVLPQPEGLLVALLAKLLRKRVVCFYVCEVILPSGVISKSVEYLLRVVNRLTLRLADSITALSDDFAKHNALLQQSDKKAQGIYPIVIPPNIDHKKQYELSGRLPQKKYYIGYLGRLASEKGIEYLLKALPMIREKLGESFVLVLAGPKATVGESNYQKRIAHLLRSYSDNVVQLGELSDAELGAFYSLLDVFVLPSVNNTEAFGMVQVEAMYCGTPVVATDLPGVRVPIHQTNMGIIVPPRDAKALAQAIVKVVRNKKQFVKKSSHIQDIFSSKKTLVSYRKIFERL